MFSVKSIALPESPSRITDVAEGEDSLPKNFRQQRKKG
jgi:hypothetical protein